MDKISPHHEEQIANFLRFSKYKRDVHVKEIDAVFEEMADSRLLDDTFTEGDVRDILDSLKTVVQTDLGKELEDASHTNALVLRQLFSQADAMELHFSVNVQNLENAAHLGEMKTFEADSEREREQAKKISMGPSSSLASLSSASSASNHVDLLRKNNDLEEEVRTWKAKFATLEARSTDMMRAKSALGSDAARLAEQLESTKMSGDAVAAKAEAEAASMATASHADRMTLDQQIMELKSELQAAREETKMVNDMLGSKVDQSKQFQQLKKMIATKNSQLKGLRVRLVKWEKEDDSTFVASSD